MNTLLSRRKLLLGLGFGSISLAAFKFWPDEGIWNPCLDDDSLKEYLKNDLVQIALTGINFEKMWDCHVHLIGTGDSNKGIWLNPKLQSLAHPLQYIQYQFYLNASCPGENDNIDSAYVNRLIKLFKQFPTGAKAMLLAFDYFHDENGKRNLTQSPYHTPNVYAQEIAQKFPDQFEWIASIHPYREDAIEELQNAIDNGARAVKWLPQAMGIDPSSPLCDKYYEILAKHNIPLLSHAGDEHAVDAGELQKLGNPLLLRRPIEQGVKVIVAHCASMGSNVDIDKGKSAKELRNIDLFSRLMDDKNYHGHVYGDISAITQINRQQSEFEKIYLKTEWHDRLIYGSDYPLPGVMPIFSLQTSVNRGYISKEQATVLSQTRKYNPALFDLLLKRMIRVKGHRLPSRVFETANLFLQSKENQS